MRRILLLCVLLAGLVVGWLKWRDHSSAELSIALATPAIDKQPAHFISRTFDPALPPADMPPLAPGEAAECDSNFSSDANVGGETRETDATHATVTVDRIKVTLQLNITVWVPMEVTQRVVEHEAGHRQISEFYYQSAGKLAQQIAARYVGRQVEISGADLNAESGKALQQIAAEINEEYKRELNPGPAQSLYDSITNHSLNESVTVQDAVAEALKNVNVVSPNAASNSGN